MPDVLFVYGTLRNASGHAMHAVLAAAGECLGAGTIAGRLVRVDWYPGLVPHDPTAGEAPGAVRGDVWRVHDRDGMRELDEYEGESYERRTVSVTMDDGTSVDAFAYVYLDATDHLEVVASGDWLAQG